jgi:hypothetical protein
MLDESKVNFAIIRHKHESTEPSSVVEIVRGRGAAERAVERHDRLLTQEKREEGWGHFLERTALKLRADLATATLLRKSRLYSRKRTLSLKA